MMPALAQRLTFAMDQNLDGMITISDVWLWFKWLYFLPGDVLIATLVGTPEGAFFEVSSSSLMGTTSGVVSGFAWLATYAGLATIYKDATKGIS